PSPSAPAIDVLPNLFFGTGRGRLRIFFAANGGAQQDRPETFATGRLAAHYAGEFRNIQTVIAPDHAVTQILGELSQRVANRFVVRGRPRQLGWVGLLQRLDASGPAVRTEPTIPVRRATWPAASRSRVEAAPARRPGSRAPRR